MIEKVSAVLIINAKEIGEDPMRMDMHLADLEMTITKFLSKKKKGKVKLSATILRTEFTRS